MLHLQTPSCWTLGFSIRIFWGKKSSVYSNGIAQFQPGIVSHLNSDSHQEAEHKKYQVESGELETEREEAEGTKGGSERKKRWKYRDHCRRECENSTPNSQRHLELPIIDFGLGSMKHPESGYLIWGEGL